jgi:transcriptional regulator of arginine metabolism
MEKKISDKKTSAYILQFLQTLLSTGQASTHEDIAAELEAQGFHVSQSKVSRLLHKLGAFKVVTANGKQIYRLPHEHGLAHEFSETSKKNSLQSFILQVTSNEMLIVVRTVPGIASFVARTLDQDQKNLHILGTIAGDDTIFIVPHALSDMSSILERVKEKLFG